jgi:EAL domain-containing protein (putative c-di-GMP-specific phosphodiesterase class I)
VQLSIDDFGTGYSSLSYLQRFPIDTLKIDRSFVMQMMENEENLAIVRTIVALAQNLGMDVVAEGVETEDQLMLLRKLECENGQGYLFSTPLGGRQLEQFMASYNVEVEALVA